MAEKFSNLNLMTKGAVQIFTPGFGGNVLYILRSLFIECTSASNISIPASISLGTNSPNYDNIIPITVLTGLTSQGLVLRVGTTLELLVAKSIPLFINVTTPATGASQTASLFLDGFYGV